LLASLASRSKLVRRAWSTAQGLRARLPHRPFPVILNYHRIAEEPFDPWGVAISPANFRDHLQWLSRNRTVLPLREFAQLHRRGKLPRNAIAITLDDGYACNSQVAAPLLKQFRLPATFFIPAELIERGARYWWDELEDMILNHAGSTLTLDGDEIPLGTKSSADRQWLPGSPPLTPRQRTFYQLHVRLSRKPAADIDRAMNGLRAQAKPPTSAAPLKRPMTPDEVRGSVNGYVEFGSHGLRHGWLPNLDLAEQEDEISGSVERCASLTGSRPAAFAYPYGMFDRRSERLTQEAGFDCACTTRNVGVSRVSRSFALPRVKVGNNDSAGLQRTLTRVRAD